MNRLAAMDAFFGAPGYLAQRGEPATPQDLVDHDAIIYDQRGGGDTWIFVKGSMEQAVTLDGRLRVTAAEGVREAVFAGMGLAVGSAWMFSPEISDGRVKRVLQDWSLPPIDLWAVFPTGRNASVKARAFTAFIEQALRNDRSITFVSEEPMPETSERGVRHSPAE